MYSLVLDTVPMSFALVTNISLTEAKKEHKKWLTKIKQQEWVNIPSDVPVTFNTRAFLALRVVEITPEQIAAEQAQQNPAMQRLFDGASKMGQNDFADNGYK